MDARHRGIQILGWLSVVAGSCLALLQIRGTVIWITQGFGAGGPQVFWILFTSLLFLALAVYLFDAGLRALSIAKGSPRSKARFGWSRIILGSIVLYTSGVDRFDLIPAFGFKHLEPENETQAHGMMFAATVITLSCILLIFSGIWRGFRPHRTGASG